MAAREHRKIHDVKQSERTIPFITGEIAFRQHVRELVFGVGVNIRDLDFGVQFFFFEKKKTTNLTQLCGFWTRVSVCGVCVWCVCGVCGGVVGAEAR